MTRKTLVVAVLAISVPLAALGQAAAPAAATPPRATAIVYGTLNVNLQTTDARDATTSSQNVSRRGAVSTDSSNVGVRVDAEVRTGLRGLAQCETSANVNGVSVSGICNRNSRVGLAGAWGTLFYGNWDTPFKAVAYGTKADDPFLNTDVFGYQGLMGSPGFNYRSGGWVTGPATPVMGFDVRANNSVAYWSPRWAGLALKAQVSADTFKNATGTQDPWLYSAAVNYDSGPLSVLAGYDRHDDGFSLVGINGTAGAAFGSTAANTAGSATSPISSVDTAWRLGAGYELTSPAGTTTIGALYEQIGLEQESAPAGALTKFSRQSWQVALRHRSGAHELRARYNSADKGSCTLSGGAACSTSGHGAQMLALGYWHHVSSSMQLYLAFAQIFNDDNARYTFSIGGSSAVAGSTPRGADPRALGLGARYSF